MSKNIVLVVMDTARAQNLSCYGHERETTPFLDSVAEDGFKVSKCYANAPWTLPSHYSMFTGMYPSEHGKTSKEDKGPVPFETLPEKLSEEGYTTIGVSNNGWISPVYGFREIFNRFHFQGSEKLFEDVELFEELREGEEEGRWNTTLEKYAYFARESLKKKEWKNLPRALYYFYAQKISSEWGDDGAEKTFGIVKQETDDVEEPFFLFINYVEPHSLYLPPKKYARKFLDTDLDEAYNHASVSPTEFIGTEDEEKADVLERLYDAELNYLDTKLERLFDHINASTDRENIFIFVGDHGELFGKNGLWEHHGSLDEEVLEVPFIVSGDNREDVQDITELKEAHDYILQKAEGSDYSFGGEIAIAEYDGFSCHMWKEPPEAGIESYALTGISPQLQLIENDGDSEVRREGDVEEIEEVLERFKSKRAGDFTELDV